MKSNEALHYSVEGHNPHWNDPFYLLPTGTKNKIMHPWQHDCMYNYAIDPKTQLLVPNLAVQAFCGSGKSFLQVNLAIYDIVSSGYTQKQLILVPQGHIHRGFVGDDDVNYMSVTQGGVEYEWLIQPDHNFCNGKNRVNGLIDWLTTPAKKLAKGFTGKTISGLNAVASHSALIHAWKILSKTERRRVIQNLTLRVDEAHHIKHVFLDEEELSDEIRLAIEYDATELGKICTYIINENRDTSKLHTTTATMYRGDRKTILSSEVRGRFVEYNLDWITHFQSLGIKSFYLQYEEYDNNPISMVMAAIDKELPEKHYIVLPSTGSKWRDETSLNTLLTELYKRYPKERVNDLVTKETQEANKARLLAEPKVKSDSNPSKFDVVVVCMLGREGTDWCPCSRIHNTAVESSVTLAVQTAGRVFRRYEGKTVVKINHYVKRFEMPRDGITKRELFTDRTNGLLVCMQYDDMTNPIIIPALPGQGTGERGEGTRRTLVDVFGDQYENVKVDLLEGYERLEDKSKESLYALIDNLCDEYGVDDDDLAGVRDALMVRLIRTAREIPELAGIDVAWLRTEGFDKIKLSRSVYCGDYSANDWQIVRNLLRDRWGDLYEEVSKVGIDNIKPGHPCYDWLYKQRQAYIQKTGGRTK